MTKLAERIRNVLAELKENLKGSLSGPHFNRHRDDEWFDKVTVECVPRYKTSHMSGDEWRISYVVKLFRKGTKLYERSYHSMDAATKHLPWVLLVAGEGSDDHYDEDAARKRQKEDDTTCFQVGCSEPMTHLFQMKKLFSREGYEKETDPMMPALRGFCDRHATRGDCGLEDADHNYCVLLEGEKKPRASDESEAVLGGVIEIGGEK